MIKTVSFIFLLLLITVSFGQSGTIMLEHNLKSHNELVNTAQKYNLKSITKRDGDKVKFKADFDARGNLLKLIDYKYKRNGYETIIFTCKKGLIVEYEQHTSFGKNSFFKYYFEYNEQNKPTKLISSFIINDSLYNRPDTIKISYNADGNVDTRIIKRHATRYFYSNDTLIGSSDSHLYRDKKIKDQRIYNEYGCHIGYYYRTDSRGLEIRDSNCELKGRMAQLKVNDEWITNWNYDRVFRTDTLIEETYFLNENFRKKDPDKMKLRFEEKLTFHYDQKGLATSTKYWNQKGKLTKEIITSYDYYK